MGRNNAAGQGGKQPSAFFSIGNAGNKRLQIAGNEILSAARIVKDGDTISGYDAKDTIIFEFNGIKNDALFVLLDDAVYDVPQTSGGATGEIEEVKAISSAMLGGEDVNNPYVAAQFNRAVLMFVQTLPEEAALEVADLYPAWETGKAYAIDSYVKHGLNADQETQIYRCIQAHTSQADWTPDVVPALFKAVGFTDDGVSVWTQPVGAVDAYQIGDRVSHNGVIYVNNTANNVWEPGVYGWTAE